MRRFLSTLAAVAILTLPATAQTNPEQVPPRQIMVMGEGQVEAVPDMATITLGVTHEAKAAREAMAATSDAVARILEQLGAMGIAERDLQTSNLTLNPVWSDRSGSVGGYNQISGFAASNTVFVRVRDLDGLGQILDAVIDVGANDFNGLSFSVQEPEPLEMQARDAAVADAMAKAVALAKAAGVTLGPVRSITDNGGGGGPVMMEMAASRKGGVPIAAGEVTVSAMVSMVFDIVGQQ